MASVATFRHARPVGRCWAPSTFPGAKNATSTPIKAPAGVTFDEDCLHLVCECAGDDRWAKHHAYSHSRFWYHPEYLSAERHLCAIPEGSDGGAYKCRCVWMLVPAIVFRTASADTCTHPFTCIYAHGRHHTRAHLTTFSGSTVAE